MATLEQISALIDYLESHQELALGHFSRTNEGRGLMKRRWVECAEILNAMSANGTVKTPDDWRTFYSDYKCRIIRKIKKNKIEMNATGGGPAKKIELTPLQERLYTILGRDLGEPLPGVRHNPLISISTLPQPEAHHSYCNNSISILDHTYTVPVEIAHNVEIATEEQPENFVETIDTSVISLEQPTQPSQEAVVQDSSIVHLRERPNRRRRLRPSRRLAVEDRAHAALEAAQSKLDAIEARNAEATLQQAQATMNLAKAINKLSTTVNKIAELVGHIAAQPKKRRISSSSDSE